MFRQIPGDWEQFHENASPAGMRTMTSDRKKPGVAFWATVVVAVALVAYPLSFGPACWRYPTGILHAKVDAALRTIYSPLADYAISEKDPVAETLWWWSQLGGGSAWKFQRNAKLKVPPYHHTPFV